MVAHREGDGDGASDDVRRRTSHREDADAALERELSAYIEMLAAEKVREGMSPEQARRQARIETGVEQVKEQVRDIRSGALFDSILRDVRFAARTLSRRPGFALVAILTLALGIGLSTAIFTVVNGVLLNQLDVVEPSRLMFISESNGDRGLRRPSATGASFVAWREDAKAFRAMAAYLPHNVDVTGRGDPDEVVASDVSTDLFALTGARAIVGRLFRQEEFVATQDVVVLDEGYWRLSFGSDSGIIGKSLVIDGRPRVVVGVAVSGWPRGSGLFFPMPESYPRDGGPTRRILVIGRLFDTTTSLAATTELATIAKRVHASDPLPTTQWAVHVESVLDTVVGSVRRVLLVLLGAVGFVLLIVCANIASLLFARASARTHEIAVRNALGASRGRVMRQLFIEGFLLTGLGGMLGVVVALWGVALLKRLGSDALPRLAEVTVDIRVLSLGAGIAILSGVLVALLPAVRASGWNVQSFLQTSARATSRDRTSRSWLVVAEIAVATILLVGASLMTRSLVNQTRIPLGFDASQLLALDIDMPASRYDAIRSSQFLHQIEERLRALPGVEGVGTARAIPFESFGPTRRFQIEGRPPIDPSGAGPGAFYTPSTPGYLSAMRIPLRRGRYLRDSDDGPNALRVVVINETMSRRYWSGDDPIGSRLVFSDGTAAQVVGVVSDVLQRQLTGAIVPAMWVPWSQAPDPSMLVVVRTTAADPLGVESAARQAVWAVDPLLPIEPRTLAAMRDESLGSARFATGLFAGFALVALVLAALGVYALVSYSVTLRTREMGLRIALGARHGQVISLIVRDGARLALPGLALGVAGALVAARALAAILYEVPSHDVTSTMVAVAVLGAAVFFASVFPARRAARVEPTDALRWTE